MSEQEKPETKGKTANPKQRDTMRQVGLQKFTGALNEATGYIQEAANYLKRLEKHRSDASLTVQEILNWMKRKEKALKNVPTSMHEPLLAMFKASEDELQSALQQMAEEFYLIDLDAPPVVEEKQLDGQEEEKEEKIAF